MLLQAYFVNKQYRRAHALLNKPELFARNMLYRYLAAMCLAECQEWDACLATIGADDIPETLAEKVQQLELTMRTQVHAHLVPLGHVPHLSTRTY